MSETQFTAKRLKELQALPLDEKIAITKERVIEWYEHFDGKVYVSFSGGKDSTVLLHLVRELYPDVPAVFSDTGLEYPEIKEHVKRYDNVEIVRPRMTFKDVITTYGYPLVSKETADAIQYARRHIGGGTTYRDRAAFLGKRRNSGGETCWDYVPQTKKPHRQLVLHEGVWQPSDSGVRASRDSSKTIGGGATRQRKRVELMGNRIDSEPG